MSVLCERKRSKASQRHRRGHPFLYEISHRETEPSLEERHHEYFEVKPHQLEPLRNVTTSVMTKRACLQKLDRIIRMERELLDSYLEESSINLSKALRASIELPEKFEADDTALANLDSFLADLADDETDASEIVKAARRRS